MSSATYRWDAAQAAADYDAAGPILHPCYQRVQEVVVDLLTPLQPGRVIDLGGGSGRLAERVLESFPRSHVTVVDQSEAFLRIARRRLTRFGENARLITARVQDDWPTRVDPPDAILSTSALHHLEPAEKNDVFAACREALPLGGLFINGDEYRPPSDAAYRTLLEEWGDHMHGALASGELPATFGVVLDAWQRRNLDGFGGPRRSGDDCHETVEEQIARLYGAGFDRVRVVWSERLWAVLVAEKRPASGGVDA